MVEALNGQSKEGMEGDVPIWSITKEYDEMDFADDETSLGRAVDVEFISIGAKHREYLVSFPYLVKRMNAIGFRLLNKEELEAIQLENSEALFKTSYKMAMKQREKFTMLDSIKEFSFLNRWFIFIRDSIEEKVPPIVLENEEDVEEEAVEEKQEPAAEAVEEEAVEEEKESVWRGPLPTKTFSSSEVIPFGIIPLYRPISGIPNSEGAVQYISLSAIVPGKGIPDPMPKELGGEEADESEIIYYPTIEHYLAGMKLKHAAPQSLLYTIMSTGGSLHQNALKKIMKHPVNSDKYYKELAAETKTIHEYMSKNAELEAMGASVDGATGSMMRDTFLRNALQYRFRYDERFRSIILAIKENKKYILHIKPVSRNNSTVNESASELYGVRNSSTGRIVGANRVGMLIMEIADFNFPSV